MSDLEKQLDEAREEGFQEGYSEGQNDANHASKDTFHLVIAWLRKRDFLQDADYPEGFTAEDIAEALNEHEENLVCLSKRADAALKRLDEVERERDRMRAIEDFAKAADRWSNPARREPNRTVTAEEMLSAIWCHPGRAALESTNG